MKKLAAKLKKILNERKKPLVGNNRSFSMRATKRKFRGNIQKFKIGSKTYKMRVKDFRSFPLD
ncbi:MAG: 50S ribosomal protein L28 [Mycoplasmataceae bacterium RV_VA103A]|nr:MAG: 50S ribosomal protein L28 [Mycoplasmataceae bacterium RV_VA103A]